MDVFDSHALGHPLGERVERKQAMRRAQALPFLVGDDAQRVVSAAVVAALLLEQLGRLAFHVLVLDQPVEQLGEGQAMLGDLGLDSGHPAGFRGESCDYISALRGGSTRRAGRITMPRTPGSPHPFPQ